MSPWRETLPYVSALSRQLPERRRLSYRSAGIPNQAPRLPHRLQPPRPTRHWNRPAPGPGPRDCRSAATSVLG